MLGFVEMHIWWFCLAFFLTGFVVDTAGRIMQKRNNGNDRG
jgi:hypothetical protein